MDVLVLLPLLVLKVDDPVPVAVINVHHVEAAVVLAKAAALLLGHMRAAPCQVGATATKIC